MLELEEQLLVVGNNLKSLEISEQEVFKHIVYLNCFLSAFFYNVIWNFQFPQQFSFEKLYFEFGYIFSMQSVQRQDSYEQSIRDLTERLQSVGFAIK